MNRLERMELLEKVELASRQAREAHMHSVILLEKVQELQSRIDALETKPRVGRPPKAKDGEGLQQPS